jgi:DNA-binding beta-propeller fold protein YncE
MDLSGMPSSLAVDPQSHRVFVANSGAGVAIVDGASNPPVLFGAGIAIGPSTATSFSGFDSMGNVTVALDPGTHELLVADRGAGAVTVLYPAS